MRINIDESVFHNYGNLNDFKRLFYILCENNNHDFFCELEVIKESQIFSELSKTEKEIIIGYFEKILLNSPEQFDIEVSDETSLESFNLNEAIRYFKLPVRIVLENSYNDSYFLEALFKNFKNKSKKINRHIASGDLVFEMAGGKGNIINLVSTKLKEFNNLPKDNYKYLRVIVVFDSDKTFPSTDSNNINLINYLTELEICYHELEKREMENYMPDIIFNNINDEFCIKYLEMNPIQKDFFDIEKGFKNKNRIDFDIPVKELYNQMSDDNFNYFRKNQFQIEGSFKADFPKYFLSEDVNQDNLKQRVSHQVRPNELEIILDKISQLL